ncbi:MAG: DUF4281 domain-containing protein [Halieaceae bacterium]|jgi:hypothetical protein|nr:DUF4281 domain-containing protein [Halieaceae bacterium]MBT5556759.1 DUF4281 domain-containing protein [Halieaceae bacterium]
MSLETVFSLCSGVALLGWIGLVVAPRRVLARDIMPSVLVPLLLGSIYASLIFAFSSQAPSEGGFGTLASVKTLFSVDGLLLAGWIHYLAFDLFVGGWIVRDSQDHEISHVLVVVCLFFTLMTGPFGLLIYLGLRQTKRFRVS